MNEISCPEVTNGTVAADISIGAGVIVHTITRCTILRRESCGGYSTRGPVGSEMTLEQARRELRRLETRYPHQHFVIVSEVGSGERNGQRSDALDPPQI